MLKSFLSSGLRVESDRDVFSSLLFNCFMDMILRETLETTPGGWAYTHQRTVPDLQGEDTDKDRHAEYPEHPEYADDLTLVLNLEKSCSLWWTHWTGPV